MPMGQIPQPAPENCRLNKVGRDTQALLRERFELGSSEALAFSYVLIAAAFLLLWGQSSTTGLIGWAVALAVVAPLPKIVQSIDVSYDRWFALELAVECAAGIVWGSVALVALPDDPVRQALLCAMLIGVMVAASTSASQFMTLHLAFLMPFAGLTIVGFLLAPDSAYGAAAMLAVAFAFSVIMAGEHRTVHHNLVDLIVQNERLVDDLAGERDALSSANEQLDHQAWSDALTGLANRAAFRRDLAAAMTSLGGEADAPITLAALDLDGFKQINDTWGHHAGDLVLIAVAEALQVAATDAESVYRLGGDELTVLSRTSDLDEFGLRLAAAFHRPFDIEGRSLSLRAGIGIATTSEAVSRDTLMRNADRALYRHKRSVDAQISHQVFDEAMRAEVARKTQLEAEVAEAFDAGRITPWLQPIVDVRTGTIVAAEALARWEHDDGVRSAASFIDILAGRGLLQQLTERTLASVRSFNDALLTSGIDALPISVNIGPAQLERVLQDADPGDLESICIGVTEESAMPNPERAAELLNRVRSAGSRVLIDDFGVGYSSLTYLRTLPITGVKVDPSFVTDIHTDPTKQALTMAILELAKALDLTVTAEGVSAAEEYHRLRSLGITAAQGNLFASSSPLTICETRARSPFVDIGTTIRAA